MKKELKDSERECRRECLEGDSELQDDIFGQVLVTCFSWNPVTHEHIFLGHQYHLRSRIAHGFTR